MTITVIGHLSIDQVHAAGNTDGELGSRRSYGGIFFSLATLASLMGTDDIIHPVFGVGDKEYDEFKRELEQFPQIDTSGVFKFKGNTNHVHFFYEGTASNRTECSNHIADPIPFGKIKPFLDADGILINMISGFDITLETLDAIRMAIRDARTPVHFDFHSLTLGIDQDSKRFRRPLTDWRRWCFMLNSIQMTEGEAMGLTAEHFDEPTLVNHLMPLMVNALVITRGERGATAILQENKKLTRTDIPSTSFGPVIDTIGCGDVFGAAFFYKSLKNKTYAGAAEFAAQMAGFKSVSIGAGNLRDFTDKMKLASGTR